MPRASASSARSAGRPASVAGRRRQPASSAIGGVGSAMPWCCRTSPMRTKPSRSYRPRPSAVACSSTVWCFEPFEQRRHQAVADAPSLARRRDDDQADRRVSRPPAPAQAGADDLPVALGDEALAVAECLFPVGRPVRPAQFVGQRMRGREVGRGHRAQRDAVGNRCFDCTHRDLSPMNRMALMLGAIAARRQPECGLRTQFGSMRCGGGSLCDNDAVRAA